MEKNFSEVLALLKNYSKELVTILIIRKNTTPWKERKRDLSRHPVTF